MTVAVQIIGIFTMLTFIFLGIWAFVIANKSYSQLKYKNYLLEKLIQNVNLISSKIENVKPIENSNKFNCNEDSDNDYLTKEDTLYIDNIDKTLNLNDVLSKDNSSNKIDNNRDSM
ncbi:Uncharacterised protein [Clostridium fallax]|uniref:Uncharacterized protein n=2 Tax=Clostridium fallax TaxID=1533 RepID=A0A1M4YWL9_9CLOT|nr:hypothetical protein [Clostridium fallax]SHF10193.1 hypothetical protein SAMN05443638_13330 [Clostridium fallax]SQB22272.1 Uncharacterised protein [Clostridium fallax]